MCCLTVTMHHGIDIVDEHLKTNIQVPDLEQFHTVEQIHQVY